MVEDHALHFYFLGGPDFVVGPHAPAAERNILGVIARVGVETGRKVIAMRRKLRDLIALAAGKAIHPVFGVPGGVSKPLAREDAEQFRLVAAEAVEFAQFTRGLFEKLVLGNGQYVDLIKSDLFTHRTYYMGMVDEHNRSISTMAPLRVVAPDGQQWARFDPADYAQFIDEHVEPWSYMKFCFLKAVGWQGFRTARRAAYIVSLRWPASTPPTGWRRRSPTRLICNTAALLGKPVHHTLANHWARLVELLYAAERMKELAEDPEIADPHVRTLPTAVPREGIGVVEAPRGTLIHHYQTDQRGLITKCNLIVATQNNAARISMGVEKAARGLVDASHVDDGILNMVEMAFRAYDPVSGAPLTLFREACRCCCVCAALMATC